MDYKKYNSTHIMVKLWSSDAMKGKAGAYTLDLVLDAKHMLKGINDTLRALAKPYRVCEISVYTCNIEMSEMYGTPIWTFKEAWEKQIGHELEPK